MALDKVKKIAIWLLVAFLVYALFKDPSKSGDIVGNIWDGLSDGVHNIGTFFDSIMGDN